MNEYYFFVYAILGVLLVDTKKKEVKKKKKPKRKKNKKADLETIHACVFSDYLEGEDPEMFQGGHHQYMP